MCFTRSAPNLHYHKAQNRHKTCTIKKYKILTRSSPKVLLITTQCHFHKLPRHAIPTPRGTRPLLIEQRAFSLANDTIFVSNLEEGTKARTIITQGHDLHGTPTLQQQFQSEMESIGFEALHGEVSMYVWLQSR